VVDFLVDGPNLSLAFAAAEHKVVGEAANLSHIQQNDIRRLLVAGRLNCLTGNLNCFQKLSLHASAYQFLLYHNCGWLSRLIAVEIEKV
jgi:hypothetical protein